MPQLHTKNGASPRDLLAFIAWAEIFLGTKLAHNDQVGDGHYYTRMRMHFACNVGALDGMRDIIFEVSSPAGCADARASFPKLFYKEKATKAA